MNPAQHQPIHVRDWECQCGHKWTAEVQLSAHTPNLSGERTVWCPLCQQRPLIGSPHRVVSRDMPPPKN